ncbi:hypothetical protein AG1IA_03403 [Rhizoctonia solani AG-1 IA]|uniref:G-protein coupled receptors family 2 profile 2 domain-containing protein n=1 Tax=Thanatephorus cucumeris (strain AG1-IA) TaxID=983506 RepID=L8X0E5_THACA|nr:hypothetical protein AG1IA_03403 [Rhizoctonia solani AG-1 IA]
MWGSTLVSLVSFLCLLHNPSRTWGTGGRMCWVMWIVDGVFVAGLAFFCTLLLVVVFFQLSLGIGVHVFAIALGIALAFRIDVHVEVIGLVRMVRYFELGGQRRVGPVAAAIGRHKSTDIHGLSFCCDGLNDCGSGGGGGGKDGGNDGGGGLGSLRGSGFIGLPAGENARSNKRHSVQMRRERCPDLHLHPPTGSRTYPSPPPPIVSLSITRPQSYHLPCAYTSHYPLHAQHAVMPRFPDPVTPTISTEAGLAAKKRAVVIIGAYLASAPHFPTASTHIGPMTTPRHVGIPSPFRHSFHPCVRNKFPRVHHTFLAECCGRERNSLPQICEISLVRLSRHNSVFSVPLAHRSIPASMIMVMAAVPAAHAHLSVRWPRQLLRRATLLCDRMWSRSVAPVGGGHKSRSSVTDPWASSSPGTVRVLSA